jgi:carotenoid cleavage dioxygenase
VGAYLRNGPNPLNVEVHGRYHWFEGDGMIHAVELSHGEAACYRNRWVRTRKLARQLGTPPPPGPREPVDGPANTHIIEHAGRLLALCESGLPHLLTRDLDTLRVEDFDAMLASPMTAHPHVDPETGGMAFFGYDPWGPPFLRYHEMDAVGRLVHTTDVEVPQATMQHDFAVTKSRVAFLDFPVLFDLERANDGAAIPFKWDYGAPARVGILNRGDRGTSTRWIEVDPCYVFHVMNAFDDGPDVVMDVCRYERAFDLPQGGLLSSGLARLERWRVDPVAGSVSSIPLDDRSVEFPRIDDARAGRPYRFGYCVEMDRTQDKDSYNALLRYDHVRDEVRRWDPGPGRSPGEPVFVRAADGKADDEGWVLSLVYDAGSNTSDLVVLDASHFGEDPEAVIHLPSRVPFGFHGSWVPSLTFR